MKRKFFCPSCGNRESMQLFIINNKGKNLPLLLSSQAIIRKSSGEVSCGICKHVGKVAEFQANLRHETVPVIVRKFPVKLTQ